MALIRHYEVQKINELNIKQNIELLKNNSHKHIWPWVFFNRFIGYREEGKPASSLARKDYFSNIKGIDVYNHAGALNDFYDIFRFSLKLARNLNTPGIVVDPEIYNSLKAYSVSYVASELNKPKDEVIRSLRNIGADLADITHQEYPEAILWFFFTGLGYPYTFLNPQDYGTLRTCSYIIQGLLDRAKERNYNFIVVSGGELGLGYCYKSLGDLVSRINSRNSACKNILSNYHQLQLGGTIALWDNHLLKKGWFLKGKCGASRIYNLEGFQPLLKHLSQSYKYIYIYNSWGTGYNPFNLNSSIKYNSFLNQIKIK
ncbi:MAG TPA: hypothetical protein DCY27_05430 [Desulfobacterales bacterium]|nr:hypothetical protein [Desulfobacterales bacterium]